MGFDVKIIKYVFNQEKDKDALAEEDKVLLR